MAVNPNAAINPVVELNSVFVGFFYELFSIMQSHISTTFATSRDEFDTMASRLENALYWLGCMILLAIMGYLARKFGII